MKIAMVSEHASPLAALGEADSGGQNVHVAALAKGLARRGHQVVVHTRRDDPSLPREVSLAPGVRVHHVDAGPAKYVPKDELLPYLPALTSGLSACWAADRPDIVHAHFWMSGVASAPAADALDVPLVMTFHALGTVKRRHQAEADTSPPARIATERALVRHVAQIIATCSDEVAELRAMGASREKVAVVPCGVDTQVFRFTAPRRKLGRFRLLTLGRLVPRKGVADVLQMLALLPECDLLVAGGPPVELLGRDPEAVRLRGKARALGVHERVHFLGGLPRSAVPAIIADCDAVVCLPWYEPFGIVPLEAMAVGRPVVGTAVGGLLDTVSEGTTGFLVPPRSPQAAATAVRRLMESRTLRLRMGHAGRAMMESRYDWSRVAEATDRIYQTNLVHDVPLPTPAMASSVRFDRAR